MKHIRPRVARPEDLICLKIQAYFNNPQRKWKDQADIAELIRNNPNLDWEQIMVYAKLFDQENILEEMRRQLTR